ncbi:MAG: GNAT family N-acetyltransferase [Anaerolineae bacterium]|nr:GNAT family N-acetyltransferase [Anaerolineae bacterium]
MTVKTRQYSGPDDFTAISNFLIAHYLPNNQDGNWLQPEWEYMHTHPNLDVTALDRIRIWEAVSPTGEAGAIVGVVNYESKLGEAYFQVKPGHEALRPEMLAYAEANLHGVTPDGQRYLHAYVNDFDTELETLVRARGYELKPDWGRPMSRFMIPDLFPAIKVPEGFRLKSLADENDLWKVHRVLWRGFNHAGEPVEEGIEGRRKQASSPNYRNDLKIVVEAPNGDFVSFCGMWHDRTNAIAYVEPVATDPDYRRMGLGRAAVLEGIRRCGAEGATVAFVGSDQRFYKALGFEVLYTTNCWTRVL